MEFEEWMQTEKNMAKENTAVSAKGRKSGTERITLREFSSSNDSSWIFTNHKLQTKLKYTSSR